jgi:hypothetical protein
MLDKFLTNPLIFAKDPPGQYEAFFLYLVTGLLLVIIAASIIAQGNILQIEVEKAQSLLAIAGTAVAVFPPCRFAGLVKWSAVFTFFAVFS